jgi:beta-galactosidase
VQEGADLSGLGPQLSWMRQQFPAHNPLYNMEYYSGWIDLEGHAHPNPRAPTIAAYAAGLDAQLVHNLSVSLYMAVGGSNFGFMGGGNSFWSHFCVKKTAASFLVNLV